MDADIYIKAFVALLVVVIAIGCVLLIIKLITKNQVLIHRKDLELRDILIIDSKRKLVVVKNNKTRYILLLSDNHNVLVDTINES